MTFFGAARFSLGVAPNERARIGWRQYMTSLITALNERGTSVLITVDEVHSGVEELRRLAATFQHFVREDLDVAIALAGLTCLADGARYVQTRSARRRARLDVFHSFR